MEGKVQMASAVRSRTISEPTNNGVLLHDSTCNCMNYNYLLQLVHLLHAHGMFYV